MKKKIVFSSKNRNSKLNTHAFKKNTERKNSFSSYGEAHLGSSKSMFFVFFCLAILALVGLPFKVKVI